MQPVSVAPGRQSSEACGMRKFPSLLLPLLLAAFGCGGGSSGFQTMGMPGVPSPTRVGANLVFAEVKVNGFSGGRLAVDTGSPLMLIDEAAFPGLNLGSQIQAHGNVTAGQ